MGTDNKKREVQRPPVLNTWAVEERSLKDGPIMGERMCCLRKLKKEFLKRKECLRVSNPANGSSK